MELGQLISFDGLRCGNPVSVTEVPVHPINQMTTGSSGQVQHLVDGCSGGQGWEEGASIKRLLLLRCPRAKRRAKQGEQGSAPTLLVSCLALTHGGCFHVVVIIIGSVVICI